MTYPSLPSQYLNPINTRQPSNSASASSVEPITPELRANAAMPYPPPTNMNGGFEDSIQCKWHDCSYYAPSPDALYEHLCNQHVGRKSTNNLCLTCGWEGCGVKCVKRDHITSHLRGTQLTLPIIHQSVILIIHSAYSSQTSSLSSLLKDLQATSGSEKA